ncbi:LysR family transcriptional regulator [Sphingomonas sp. ID0503]|uniref:LysR family transcriptional regulator n=1 Tax=Sphingomonas sp. ID0503 TaxID=3399691 RepID=UPI003AFB4456
MTGMDIRHLRYFVGIADCGSLMKASERLHVAQPALSVHIANLEVELGVKLLERSNRGVELTEEGHNLYARATTLLSYYQETISSIRDRRAQATGTVSVGVPSTMSGMIAAELYRRVRDELPDVTLYMTDASTAMLYEWLQDGRLDFSILFSLPESSNLDLIPLDVEEFCLVSKAGTSSGTETIEFDELFEHPLVVSCQSTTWRKILDHVAEKKGRTFKASIETEAVSVIKSIVRSGEACGVLPLSCVVDEVRQGVFDAQRVINPDIKGILALANLPSLHMTPAKRAIRDLVVRVMREVRAGEGGTPALNNVTPIFRAVPSKLLPMARQSAR